MTVAQKMAEQNVSGSWNKFLNRISKWAVFVVKRVRVWSRPRRHISTQTCIECPSPLPLRGCRTLLLLYFSKGFISGYWSTRNWKLINRHWVRNDRITSTMRVDDELHSCFFRHDLTKLKQHYEEYKCHLYAFVCKLQWQTVLSQKSHHKKTFCYQWLTSVRQQLRWR